MEPPLFIVDPEEIGADLVDLDEVESHHAVKVLRLERSDQVLLVDGRGMACRGVVAKVGRNGVVTVETGTPLRNFGEPLAQVTLAAGLSTADKFDEVIEKATELGVRRIVPLLTSKSKVKLEDPARIKRRLGRFEKICRAAMKQCRRSFCPEMVAPRPLSDFLAAVRDADLALVFDPNTDGAVPLSRVVTSAACRDALVIVGPESGFTADEVNSLRGAGAVVVTLGKRVLRAENAGPVAVALVMHALGELS